MPRSRNELSGWTAIPDLQAVRQRYGTLAGLELHCVDLTGAPIQIAPVELVHAGLVFEHTGLGRSAENAVALVAEGGKLSVVLQLPSATEQGVAASRFASMQTLRDSFTLIDESEFRDEMEKRGFALWQQERRSLPAGKAFWMGIFTRQNE